NEIAPRELLARIYIRQKNWGSADRQIAALHSLRGNSADTYVLAGMLDLARGNQKDARASYDRALQLDSKNLEALNGAVALDLAAKRPDAAKARIEHAVAADKRNRDLLYMSAQAEMLMNDLPAAERLLKQA